MSPSRVLMVTAWLAAGPAGASHDWVGVDLCRTYPERMPPELDRRLLPDPDGEGAWLVGRYCGQCHFAPGPGQHTAAEWAGLVPRMGLLMEVSARFLNRSPPIEQPSAGEQGALLAYLQRYALRPLADPGAAPPAYGALCGDCHAAPDPVAYAGTDWSTLLARMDRHRGTMRRAPAPPSAQAQVAAYLGVSIPSAQDPFPGAQGEEPHGRSLGRWLALGPVLLLTLLGLARWRLGPRGRP